MIPPALRKKNRRNTKMTMMVCNDPRFDVVKDEKSREIEKSKSKIELSSMIPTTPQENHPLLGTRKESSARLVEFLFDEDDESLKPELEDGKLTRSYFERVKMLEYGNLVFSLTSLGLSMLQYILEYEERDQEYSYALLSIVFVCTILLIILTVIRYLMQIRFNKIRKTISKKETIWSTGDWKYMIGEIILVSFHPSPFLVGIQVHWKNAFFSEDIYYHVNEFFHILILLRFVIVARVLLVSTVWISNRSIRVCNMYGTNATYLFGVQCLMKTNPFLLVSLLLFFCLLIFGYALLIAESPLSRLEGSSFNLSNFGNAVWCMIITITTVGFGDYYPRSAMGRFVVVFSSIFGMSIVSMMVVTITNTLSLSTFEERAQTVLSKLVIKDKIRKSAAKILTGLTIARNHFRKTKTIKKNQGIKLKNEAKKFNELSR